MSLRVKVPRDSDPLGLGLKSIPRPLQRLWLLWRGNPYFEAEAGDARRTLAIPKEGFRDAEAYTEWFATRWKRHGHDDRLAQGRIFLEIEGQRITDGEALARHLAEGVNWGSHALAVPSPCCPADPLYETARELARRYGIEEAQAEPGFEAVVEDVAGWLLFNRWHPRRSHRGRTPILETVRQDAGSADSIVVSRVREEHIGLKSRGGEGGALPLWRQWWEADAGGASLQDIALETENRLNQEFDERSIGHGIAQVETLMRPLVKN